MRRTATNVVVWVLGVFGIAALGYYLGLASILQALSSLSPSNILVWAAITVLTRVVLIDALTRPVMILGSTIRRRDAFWVGWLRSFLNHIVPTGGTAYLAHFLRRRTDLGWGEMVALASPQVLFLGIAVSVVGLILVLLNASLVTEATGVLLSTFGMIGAASLSLILFANKLTHLTPSTFKPRIAALGIALQAFHSRTDLIARLVAVHSLAIFLRGLRLWLLFAAIGHPEKFATIMLLSCIGELAVMVQITPGGIGVREGTLVGAGLLLGLDAKVMTAVAIVDRLLTVGIICCLAPLALYFLHRPKEDDGDAKVLGS